MRSDLWEYIISGALIGGAVGGPLGGAIAAATISSSAAGAGAAAGLGVGMLSGGVIGKKCHETKELSRTLSSKEKELRELRKELERINAERKSLQSEIDRLNVRIKSYKIQIATLKQKDRNNGESLSRLRERVQDLESQMADKECELNNCDQEKERLKQEIDELRAGDGLSPSSQGAIPSDVLYPLPTIFDYLRKILPKQFPIFIIHNDLLISRPMLDKTGQSHIAAILPPLVAINANLIFTTNNVLTKDECSQSDLARLQLLLNRYLLSNLKRNYAKIIFPFLDMSRKHWLTAEFKLTQKDDRICELQAYLHDPRGGGLLQEQDFQILATTIEECLKAKWPNVMLQTCHVASPYQSCRQSKPDRISCGPLVIKEISMRLKDETLDRNIPYQYGASEIVQQQKEAYSKACDSYRTDSVSVIATDRYRFLARTMGRKYQEAKSDQEKINIRLTYHC